MKNILIVLGIIITFSSCYNKRTLPYHMNKERGKAAEMCMDMFPPKTDKETIIETEVVYRDTTIIVKLPFSTSTGENKVQLPESMKGIEKKLGFNPCDSCYSEEIRVETGTSIATGTVSGGRQTITIKEKDSLLIRIKEKETLITTQERILNEYERGYISKQEELAEVNEKYIKKGVWTRIWFWLFIAFFVIAVIEFYIIKWSPSKLFK